MEKRKSPNAFIVVLPGEIIEIPQNSDKSWLTLFYSLPRELAEKWKPAYDLPRCPYEVLRMDKYDHIVCDDMLPSSWMGGSHLTILSTVVRTGLCSMFAVNWTTLFENCWVCFCSTEGNWRESKNLSKISRYFRI